MFQVGSHALGAVSPLHAGTATRESGRVWRLQTGPLPSQAARSPPRAGWKREAKRRRTDFNTGSFHGAEPHPTPSLFFFFWGGGGGIFKTLKF